MKRILPVVICVLSFLSCVEDENPDSPSSDKFKVQSVDYIDENQKMYIIQHDSIGKAIAYSAIQNGETVEFLVDKDRKYFISIYTITKGEYGHQEHMSTFSNQDLTFGMVLKKDSSKAPVQTGTFKVKVTDDEQVGAYVTAEGWMSDFSVYTNLYDENAKLFSGVKHYMAIASRDSERRYSYIDNPQKDKTYNLDYKQMKAFDIILEVPKEDFLFFGYRILSLDKRDGRNFPNYILGDRGFYNAQEDHYKLEYIGDLKTYATSITAYKAANQNLFYYYSKIGSPPDKITFLDIDDVKIAKNTISDFQFETTVEDAWHYSVGFQSSKSVTNGLPTSRSFIWSINGPASSFSITLPEELKEAHPHFLSDLSHLYLGGAGITKKINQSNSEGMTEDESISVYQLYNN
ncbi:hypothetical protein SAMN04489724_3174 [Algoriphagus locisalis]|uniref:Uncharacterized protein n=1 Tax=Algoriphagus locisalis TaxID=305507 RepID=A0A1I7CGI3_9BACT|nr:hypothetical protein [Algoriphagus locisalis]SFT98560.1 hypothetical protein SAMN04489724_3174 [Algoriphagus locisalis]